MTVRVEKLSHPVPSLLGVAILGLLSTTAAVVVRWWQRPAPLTMSEDWLNDRARTEAQRGWE